MATHSLGAIQLSRLHLFWKHRHNNHFYLHQLTYNWGLEFTFNDTFWQEDTEVIRHLCEVTFATAVNYLQADQLGTKSITPPTN